MGNDEWGGAGWVPLRSPWPCPTLLEAVFARPGVQPLCRAEMPSTLCSRHPLSVRFCREVGHGQAVALRGGKVSWRLRPLHLDFYTALPFGGDCYTWESCRGTMQVQIRHMYFVRECHGL